MEWVLRQAVRLVVGDSRSDGPSRRMFARQTANVEPQFERRVPARPCPPLPCGRVVVWRYGHVPSDSNRGRETSAHAVALPGLPT